MPQSAQVFQSLLRVNILKRNELTSVIFLERCRLIFRRERHQTRQTTVERLRHATTLRVESCFQRRTRMNIAVGNIDRAGGIDPPACREICGFHVASGQMIGLQIMQRAAWTAGRDGLAVFQRHTKRHPLAFLTIADGTHVFRPSATDNKRNAGNNRQQFHDACAREGFTSLCHFHSK